ncbi:MAG TPA: hypothetical protein VHE30_05645 [Polyangiaceae bacterium]|nr:hypothetical protein [Polyangiaceae bacterium]
MTNHAATLASVASVIGLLAGCDSTHGEFADREVGPFRTARAVVTLANAPADASCVRVKVAGTRADVRTFQLESRKHVELAMESLPVGTDTFSVEAFSADCAVLDSGVSPRWYSSTVVANVSEDDVARVSLALIPGGEAPPNGSYYVTAAGVSDTAGFARR